MPPARVAESPNVLLLFVDQMRFDALRCAGHPYVITPGLDRLAAEGTRFDRCYTSVPVCIAARHALLYGHRCSVTQRFANNVPAVEPLLYSLPQLLANHGYATRAIGKMHWRPVRRHHGFDRMELMEEIPDYREDDEYLLYLKEHGYGHVRAVHGIRHLLYMMPQRSVLPVEHHGSTWVADRTIDFLRQHRRRPFFCWSSWIAPHPPFNAPEPYAEMYDLDDVDDPVDPHRGLDTLSTMVHRLHNFENTDRLSPRGIRRIRALYHAQISLIDHGVDRILDALEALDLVDNTLVIFTSDHGEMLGDHGLWQKSQPYDPSARVPFLMRLPGRVAAGRVADEIVSLIDLLPTCLDLAGVDYPGTPSLPGHSLLAADGGGAAVPRDEFVIEHGSPPHRWLSLLRGSLKYNLYLTDGFEELYDLATDPHECDNLLLTGDAEARDTGDRMRRDLVDWERRHGYERSLSGDAFVTGERQPLPPRRAGNLQFPRWLDRLDPTERAGMNSLGEEMLQVTAKEDTYSIEDLDLSHWLEAGGEICEQALRHLRASR